MKTRTNIAFGLLEIVIIVLLILCTIVSYQKHNLITTQEKMQDTICNLKHNIDLQQSVIATQKTYIQGLEQALPTSIKFTISYDTIQVNK